MIKIAADGSSRNRLRFIAFVLSFRKLNWNLEDYPRIYVDQIGYEPGEEDRRQRWRVDIVGWLMHGLGNTPEEAARDLEINFSKQLSEGKKPLRPGRNNIHIIFASTARISQYRDLELDFVSEILGLPWALMTDESSLWDFHGETNNDEFIEKIRQRYGVDVSDIAGARIADIFERISASQKL
ncbi:MAG: hypothetical protein JSS87_06025 [Acidobacteria bacterium]|nr:hypothetical protein [Acidobacteriota bacterium]